MNEHDVVGQHPLNWLFERHANDDSPGGFIWVPNLAEMEEETRAISPELTVRPATAAEVEEIRFLLVYFGARLFPRNPWETRAVSTPEGKGKWNTTYEPLPPDRLRYHLIVYTCASNVSAHQLLAASVMSTAPAFEWGYGMTRPGDLGGGGMVPFGAHGSRAVDMRAEACFEDVGLETMNASDAKDLAEVYGKLVGCRDNADTLNRAIAEYQSLREVRREELRLLGFFAILESLLVHKPKLSDPYDSITRQVSKKMCLLGRRFARPLDYSRHVDINAEKTWTKLYALRSEVAHGSKPDFSAGPLTPLKKLRTAEELLREAVRCVLRQRLEEPDLVSDLKEC